MRISDWSSDVCSSDLDTLTNYEVGLKTSFFNRMLRFNGAIYQEDWNGVQYALPGVNGVASIVNAGNARVRGRSEERRVGNECVSTCSSRRSPSHYKK